MVSAISRPHAYDPDAAEPPALASEAFDAGCLQRVPLTDAQVPRIRAKQKPNERGRRSRHPISFQQLLASRHFDESGEPIGFGRARATPGAVIRKNRGRPPRPARQRAARSRRPVQVGQTAERAIEHPGPQTHAATGALEHVVHDREAVQVAIGKREEDLEPVRLQRDWTEDFLFGMGVSLYLSV